MNTEQLELEVGKARERVDRGGGSLSDRLLAFDALSDAQRKLAAARGMEHAIAFDIGCFPEAAVSGPLLFQSDCLSFLTFNAMKQTSRTRREDVGTAIVEIHGCLKTKFGHPNDEALQGHPLYEHGLSAYGVFEVINSAWCRRIADINRVGFPNTTPSLGRHLIFTFHDSTFECVADSIEVSLSQASIQEIANELTEKLLAR